MTISRIFTGTVRGETVRLVVVRNNGDAWGVAELPSGEQRDVVGNRDVYDDDDETAARYLFRVARRGFDGPAMTRVTFRYPPDGNPFDDASETLA